MTAIPYDRNHLFDSSRDFFEQRGSAVMKLSPATAQGVCEQALRDGLLVVRIEGGIWHHPGFEARIDCIWDGLTPPTSRDEAEKNNKKAENFIKQEQLNHDAFIITTMPIVQAKTSV